ncbi:60S ribosomal protein L17-2-like protein [Tanacetum coccineum]
MPEALVPRTGTHRKQSMRSGGRRCNWNTRETAHALRGMPLIKAKRYLENVLAHKQAIPFTRLSRGNADIDAEVKGWMWMLFTSFTSRPTRHKNKDVVHLVLTEELTSETQTDSSVSQAANHNIAQYWISTRKV